MDKLIWKLDNIGERLWILANMTAQQAGSLYGDGRGLAIIAEETRKLAKQLNKMTERAMFENEDIDPDVFLSTAKELYILALNYAIESANIGPQGRGAAVIAEDIRDLAQNIISLFGKQDNTNNKQIISPWPKHPLSTVDRGNEYFRFFINGTMFVENLKFMSEVAIGCVCKNGHINIRGNVYPVIDCYEMMGQMAKHHVHLILHTPWTGLDQQYAVAADADGLGLFYCNIGKPIAPPADMPLVKFVRECWDNENGEPFYFMDWPRMA